MSLIEETFKTKKAVIGVIHLPLSPAPQDIWGKKLAQ